MNPKERESLWTNGNDWNGNGPNYDDNGNDGALGNISERWLNKFMVGEVSYDYGAIEANGKYLDNIGNLDAKMNSTLLNSLYTNNFIYFIKKYHFSTLSWIADYEKQNNEIQDKNINNMQKSLGYRFVLTEASYKTDVNKDENLKITFKVRNEGSAPFYYPWPLDVSLYSLDDHRWKINLPFPKDKEFYANDLPNSGTQTYSIDVTVPEEAINGEYYLGFSIVDPGSGVDSSPAVKFANKNYFTGGIFPIGKIGINTLTDGKLDKNQFDDIANDTLRY